MVENSQKPIDQNRDENISISSVAKIIKWSGTTQRHLIGEQIQLSESKTVESVSNHGFI